METRSTKNKPLSESELEEVRLRLDNKEARIRDEVAMFREQREEFFREKEMAEREMNKVRRELTEKEIEVSKKYEMINLHEPEPDKLGSEFGRELAQLRREMQVLKSSVSPTPVQAPIATRTFDANTSAIYYPHDFGHDGQSPRLSFREALETIPIFDGRNIPLSQFSRACRRAADVLPRSAERNLTRLLTNKLHGRAYYAVEDEPCETVAQLIDLLSGAFGSQKTIDQYRGELSMVYVKPGEHILDYIARVKELRSAILDTERRCRGSLSNELSADIDGLTARSFCEGLPPQLRHQVPASVYDKPFEAFSFVKILSKRQELDIERFETPRRYDELGGKQRVHPISRPLAHSTPTRPIDRRGPNLNYSRENSRTTNVSARNENRVGVTGGDSRGYTPDRASQPRPTSNTPERNVKFCRYCKNAGHEIEECRKRQYNNAQRQGNLPGPSRPSDQTRAGPSQPRPVRAIETISESEESESLN